MSKRTSSRKSKVPSYVRDQINTADEAQPGAADDLTQKLNKIRAQLKAGNVLDQPKLDDLQAIKSTLGPSDYTQSLDDYNNLNRMKLIGNFDTRAKTFGGGISETGTAKALLTPHLSLFPIGGTAMLAHTALGLSGIHGTAAAIGLPVGQAVVRSGVRGFDNLLGNRNPLDQFTRRFRGDVSPTLGSEPTMTPGAAAPLGPTVTPDITAPVDNLLGNSSQLQPQGPQAPMGAPSPSVPAAGPSMLTRLSQRLGMSSAAGDPTATGDPLAPAATPAPRAPASPLNFRDVLAQRKLAQSAMDKASMTPEASVSPEALGSRGDVSMAKQAAARANNTNITGDTISTTKDGSTVVADASSVAKQAAWAAAVRKRIGVRSEAIDEAKQAVDNDAVAIDQLDQLKSDLTAQHLPSQDAAKAVIEAHVRKMAHRHQHAVRKVLSHNHRLMSTFKPV